VHGDKILEARRCSEKHGEDFAGPGGHSENLEAQMSFLRGSWRLCTFSLIVKSQRNQSWEL